MVLFCTQIANKESILEFIILFSSRSECSEKKVTSFYIIILEWKKSGMYIQTHTNFN